MGATKNIGNKNAVGGLKKVSMATEVMSHDEMLAIRVKLLQLSNEFLEDADKKIRFEAWRELLKYSFAPKKEISIPASMTKGGHSIEELILKARRITKDGEHSDNTG